MIEIKISGRNKEELFEGACVLFYAFASDNQKAMSNILAELDDQYSEIIPNSEKTVAPPEETKTAKQEKPKKQEKEPEPETEPEEPKVASIDELRAAFAAKNTAANRPKLKAILTDLGASKITQLSEDKWDLALEQLEAI